METNRMKIVYVVSDRSNRKYESRIGLAFVDADGSLSVKLDAIPVSGEMRIRDYVACAEPPVVANGRPLAAAPLP